MKKLRLNMEALSELGSDELASIAGATHLGCGATDPCTHVSCNAACQSVDPRACFGLTTPVNCLTNNCNSLTGVCCA